MQLRWRRFIEIGKSAMIEVSIQKTDIGDMSNRGIAFVFGWLIVAGIELYWHFSRGKRHIIGNAVAIDVIILNYRFGIFFEVGGNP